MESGNLDGYTHIESMSDITLEDVITVQLRFPIEFGGTKYDYIKLRCPNVNEMDVMEDSKLSEKKKIQSLLTKIAIEPPLDPKSIGSISHPDFVLINRALLDSGYIGLKKVA